MLAGDRDGSRGGGGASEAIGRIEFFPRSVDELISGDLAMLQSQDTPHSTP
jgi:hypothetical protein